ARVVLTGHADASWVDDLATQRTSQGYTFSLGSGSVSWQSTRSSYVLSSSFEAEIYVGAMAAQELRWLTYLLTDLEEAPRSPPVLNLTTPAASAPPLQPARRSLATRSLPLQPARPLAAPAARLPPLQLARRPLAARSLSLADHEPPSGNPLATPCSLRAAPCSPRAAPCGPLAAPCNPRATLWQPARRPLQPARCPLAACSLPLAARAPPSGSPLAALSPGRPSHAPPCPALRTSLVLARRSACVLLCWSRATLLCPLWLLSVYSPSLAPPATADSATRSQWLTCDVAARLAVCNHLPLAKRAHFGQHKTAKALYDAVVTRYSSPATVALCRLILPYMFPEFSAFATVEDLVTHLRTSDACYRSALPVEFLHRNPPPMYITLYFIVTRLPDSLRSVRDHFLALDPTDLTIDLLKKHLLAAETSVVTVGAACGTPCTPFFEGCSPSPLAPSYASAAAVDILGAEDVGAASALSGKCYVMLSFAFTSVCLPSYVRVLHAWCERV
ncbi:unnamed protein product, partial [Closterium sp. NIES-54]